MGQIKNIKLHIVTDIKNIHIDTPTTVSRMSSHKTFIIKRKLARKMNMNRPVPQWVRKDRKQNTIQCQEKTLEKNQTRNLRSFGGSLQLDFLVRSRHHHQKTRFLTVVNFLVKNCFP